MRENKGCVYAVVSAHLWMSSLAVFGLLKVDASGMPRAQLRSLSATSLSSSNALFTQVRLSTSAATCSISTLVVSVSRRGASTQR